ncbi:MAG: aldo/keto reductase [Burkholderiaceae bacterium]
MKLRRLGRTDLYVSELGMGICFVADQGQDVVSHGIHLAIDRGINYFDSAPYYSQGHDEKILGDSIKGIRSEVVISTKVGYMDVGQDHRSATGLMNQLNQSLERLSTNYVDILQIHEADFRKWWANEVVSSEEGSNPRARLIQDDENYDFARSPVVDFLYNAKKTGKTRYIGITGKDARQLERVVKALDFDAVMVAYQLNPVMRAAAQFLLPTTQRREMGVLIAAPMMKGLLVAPKIKWREQPPAWMNSTFYEAYFAYVDLAERLGITLPELTLRWLLGEKRQHSIVFGFGAAQEIESNVFSVEKGPLSPVLQTEINALGIVHPLVFQGRNTI